MTERHCQAIKTGSASPCLTGKCPGMLGMDVIALLMFLARVFEEKSMSCGVSW